MVRMRYPVLLAVLLAVAAGACGGESRPAPAPAVDHPPIVTISGPGFVHEGFAATWAVVAEDPEGWPVTLAAGIEGFVPDFEHPGRATIRATFAGDAPAELVVQARDGAGNSALARLRVEVIPRRVVVIGGIQSEASCEDATPAWLREAFEDPALARTVAVEATDIVRFSYSGEYCFGGLGAQYESEDTCGGIAGADGAAAHLRALVDSLAPSKVTVVGYSMGGLVAAYLAGSDPAWAEAHLASVVAVDSPLRGVPRMNLEVLRLAGMSGNGCGPRTPTLRDLADGDNPVIATAARASAVVPLYTVDATQEEGPFGGIREAVPGNRARLEGEIAAYSIATDHRGAWRRGDDARTAPRRLAIICAVARRSGAECVAGSG